MRTLMLLCVLGFSSFARAEWQQLPTATINQDTLGGSVLMLQMKYSLVISGKDEKQIIGELGEGQKKAFYKAMVMDASPAELRLTFGSADRKVTDTTINRYESTIGGSKPLTMN